MEIGYKLKKIREAKRISQQEVADFLGISQRTYSNMESNNSKFSLKQLLKLSEYLDFDIAELLQELGFIDSKNDGEPVLNAINISKVLIEQYEARLREKEDVILLLKDKINELEKK